MFLLGIIIINSFVYAENLDSPTEVLTTIDQFATKICGELPTKKGNNSSIELSGTAKAELLNLLKKLANIGIEGTGKYTHGEYEGVLQKDLALLLTSTQNCRKDLADKLIEKLLPTYSIDPFSGTRLPTKDNKDVVKPKINFGLFCCDSRGNRRCPSPYELPLGSPCLCESQGEGKICN
jgi:hypothetical protein